MVKKFNIGLNVLGIILTIIFAVTDQTNYGISALLCFVCAKGD